MIIEWTYSVQGDQEHHLGIGYVTTVLTNIVVVLTTRQRLLYVPDRKILYPDDRRILNVT